MDIFSLRLLKALLHRLLILMFLLRTLKLFQLLIFNINFSICKLIRFIPLYIMLSDISPCTLMQDHFTSIAGYLVRDKFHRDGCSFLMQSQDAAGLDSQVQLASPRQVHFVCGRFQVDPLKVSTSGQKNHQTPMVRHLDSQKNRCSVP